MDHFAIPGQVTLTYLVSVSSTCTSCMLQYCLPSIFISVVSLPVFSTFFFAYSPSSPLSVFCMSRPTPLNISMSLLTPLFSLCLCASLCLFKAKFKSKSLLVPSPTEERGTKGKRFITFWNYHQNESGTIFLHPKKRKREMKNGRKTRTRNTIKREKAC